MYKPESCRGCELYEKGVSFSEPDGEALLPIVFVGESLGDIEAREGKPFQEKAAAGSKLKQCFTLAEGDLGEPVRRSMFKFWNLVACQPPYNLLDGMFFEQGVIEHCRQAHFNDVINSVATKEERVVVALGNLPLKYLTGATGVASEKQSISHLQGFVLKGKYGLTIPGLHPSYIKRGKPAFTPMLVEVIKRAIAVVRGEYVHRWHKDYKKPDYNVYPGLDDAWSFYHFVEANPRLLVTFDIETTNSAQTEEDERNDETSKEIIQVQFSIGKRKGIAFPYTGEYIKVIDAILALPNMKANHNTWNFDNPLLRAKGHIFGGFIHDTMWMFKHYQPGLPRNLQNVAMLAGYPFPWKHLFTSNLGEYGCSDVDAVQWIFPWLVKTMKSLNIWHGYRDQVAALYCPTLMRASDTGIPVNEERRLELYNVDENGNATGEFEEIRKNIDSELQGLIPDELRNIEPVRKTKDESGNIIRIDYGYIREPKDIQSLRNSYEIASAEVLARGRKVKYSFDELARKKLNLERREFESYEGGIVERWVKVKEFKPSFEQVVKYIKWKKESLSTSSRKEDRDLAEYYEVPKMPKIDKTTGERVDRDTTGRKVLEDLFYETGDRVLEAVLELRSVNTTISNYIPNWKPKADGAVHTTWKFPSASNQLSTANPSILNCSKHTDNGQRFRRIVEAPPGYSFIELDKKSYHVATMAFLARSRNYMRFSQIDPHSIFTSAIMPREWGPIVDMSKSDNEIREYCAYIKKRCKGYEVDIRQKVAKPAVLGNQLLLGPKKLHLQNRRFITSINQAKDLQAAIKDMFSEVTETQDNILEEAHANHRLHIPEFGKNQWFYDVFSWRYLRKLGIWDRRKSTDAEKAVAFLVQGYAFGELHWDILEAEDRGYNERWNFINTIHDSVIYMPRDNELEQAAFTLYNLYSRPCHLMVNEATGPEGFQVGVEIAIGKNWQSRDWAEKNGIHNPDGFREIGGKEMWERFGIAA